LTKKILPGVKTIVKLNFIGVEIFFAKPEGLDLARALGA